MSVDKYNSTQLLNPLLLLYGDLGDSREISRELRACRQDVKTAAADAQEKESSGVLSCAQSALANSASLFSALGVDDQSETSRQLSVAIDHVRLESPRFVEEKIAALEGAAESMKEAEAALTEQRQILIHPTNLTIGSHPAQRA